MPAILATDICKRYGSTVALRNLSLSVEPGSCFGLLGPNGAGKSTFMAIVSGFLSADSGSLSLCGQPLDPDNMEQKRLLGLAPQHLALYKDLTAEANLSLFAQLYGLKGKERKDRIDAALEIAMLGDRRRTLVKEFSGGMKRRLNLAIAVLHQPKVLLCDEPTAGVDPQSRNAIFDTLLALRRSGTTLVYSTHYMEEAERLCDTIAIIDHGSILRMGDLDTLLAELPPVNSVACRLRVLDAPQRAHFESFGSVATDGGNLLLQPKEGFRLSGFYQWIEEQGLNTRAFQVNRPSLENLFLHLTGRDLRE